MATRCMIGKDNGGEIKAIYSHWDGYPQHTGAILKEHYTDENKIDQLLNLGSLSIIGPKLNIDEDLRNKVVKFTEPSGKEITFSVTIEDGVLTYMFTDDKGEIIILPDNSEAKDSFRLFDFSSYQSGIKERCNSISSNNKEIEEYWDKLIQSERETSIAFHRDRGESLDIYTYYDEEDYCFGGEDCGVNYLYLYKNGEWLVYNLYHDNDFKKF